MNRYLPQDPWDRTLSLITVALLTGFCLFIPGFYDGFGGTLAITEQFLPFGFVAIGLAIVILTGGIDLSVGAIASLAAVIMALLTKQSGVNIWLAALIAIGIGVLLGWLNGLIITRLRIEPLIATLATSFIYASLATAFAGPAPPYGFVKSFAVLGTGTIGGIIPVPLVLFAALAFAFTLLIKRTGFGRRVIMIGYNRDAAHYAGVAVPTMLRRVYALSGLMAAIAGIMLASYYDAVRPDMGNILLLTAITMVVLGGVSIFGGEGGILGVVLGVLILGILRQGMLIAGFSDMITTMLTGAILLVSIGAKNLLSDRGFGFGAVLLRLVNSPKQEVPPPKT
ncbi:ABC transporter permease [Acidiphilium acidophilum]|uniref:Autoinducer 2 import system permease protein LsrD n=1 Tax=Acidiphilium acidophilum TaxID=76588 RepID=A0AAW9DKG8_ACIAO|nr:ABC transporter permease [Acidiphilium acidophilum]MDX5929579.1 ABC transporter permease [Acidiphilium acidophilum]